MDQVTAHIPEAVRAGCTVQSEVHVGLPKRQSCTCEVHATRRLTGVGAETLPSEFSGVSTAASEVHPYSGLPKSAGAKRVGGDHKEVRSCGRQGTLPQVLSVSMSDKGFIESISPLKARR